MQSNDQHMCSSKYFKPFTIADEFSSVVDQVTRLLQPYDPGVLIEQCESIKSSSVHDISFFSKDQLQQLNEYRNTPLLLQELSHLWSCCNHSVLRVLIGCCDEAVKLLDEFDCHIDPLEPIGSYPLTEVAPVNATTHTTLEIKCNKTSLQEFSLQNAIDIGSLVTDKCDVTQHCLQLLGATQGFVTLYWSIPKCVLHLINTKVLQHSSYFHKKGVLEVMIHPYARINTSTSADIDVGYVFNYNLIAFITLYKFQECRAKSSSLHVRRYYPPMDPCVMFFTVRYVDKFCLRILM